MKKEYIKFIARSEANDYECERGEVAASRLCGFESGYGIAAHLLEAEGTGGDCGDLLPMTEPTEEKFPQGVMPRIRFALVRRPCAPYSAVAGEYPTLTIRFTLTEQESPYFASVMAREPGHTPAPISTAIANKIGYNIANGFYEIRDRAFSAGLFTEPFHVYAALRLRNGLHAFPTAPVLMRPDTGAVTACIRSYSVQDGQVTMRVSYQIATCALGMRLESEPEIPANLQNGAEGIDLFFPQRTQLLDTSTGKLTGAVTGGESISCEFKDGKPGGSGPIALAPQGQGAVWWVFDPVSETTASTQRGILSDPRDSHLTSSIRMASLPQKGEWIFPELELAILSSTGKGAYTPDWQTNRRGSAPSLLLSDGATIAWDPTFTPPAFPDLASQLPALPTPEGASTPDSGKIITGIRKDGRTRYLATPMHAGELEAITAHTATGIVPGMLSYPDADAFTVILEWILNGETKHLTYELKGHRDTGIACSEAGGSLPSPENGAWSPPEGNEEDTADFRWKESGKLLHSLPGYPGIYPGAGVTDLHSGEIMLLIEPSLTTGLGTKPLVAFSGSGVMQLNPKETTLKEGKESATLNLYGLTRTLTLLAPLSKGQIADTPEGIVFLTKNGLIRLAGTTATRIATEAGMTEESHSLRYHLEPGILELTGGGGSRYFDLKEGKEIHLTLEMSDDERKLFPDEILETCFGEKGRRWLLTRPWNSPCTASVKGKELPRRPVRLRTVSRDGVGQGGEETLWILMGSDDLKRWKTEAAGRGGESGLIPSARRGWWRAALSLPKEKGIPSGLEIFWI